MSPYERIRSDRISFFYRWVPSIGQGAALIAFVGMTVGATVLLPPAYSPGLLCGVLFFLFSLIRLEFGLYVVIFAMLLSPEIAVGRTTQRAITVRIEDFLILGLTAAWLLRSTLERPRALFRSSPLNRPIYSFVIFAAFSTTWGIARGHVEDQTAIFYFLKLVEFFLIFFLTFNIIQDEQTIRRFIILFLLMGLIIGAYGVIQIGRVERVTAPFEGARPEPNTLGGYLTLILSVALAIFIYAPREQLHYRALSLSILVFCLITLLFTLSRASFVGFLFMLGAMGVISRRFSLIYFIIVLLIISPFILPEEVLSRVNYTFTGPPGNEISIFGLFSINVDSSTYERVEIWNKVAFKLVRSPIFGYGLTAEHILDSQFARFLVEVGCVGTALFIWILVRIFRCAWYLFRHSTSWFYRALALGYLAAFMGVIVHSFGTITFYIVRIMEPFWFFTAIIVYLYLRQKSLETSKEPDKIDKPGPVRWIRAAPERRPT